MRPDAAEAFAEKIGNIINSGTITVMLSIGHRTGLFDAMAGQPSRTSAEIAAPLGLSERYVREWLASMVTGGIVHYDPIMKTYFLPDAHSACLTRGAPLGNFAVYAQFIPMAGAVQDTIIDRFTSGEGTSYDDYPCFHSIMAEDSGQNVVDQMFNEILPLAGGIRDRLEAGIDVLDAGCGSGRALIAMAARYPNSRFTGYDLCADAIATARRSAAKASIANVSFTARDLTGFDEVGRYDFVTSFDAVHDQKDPQGLLTGIYRALRNGGVHLMQDIGGSAHLENNIDFPFAAFLYTLSCLHCMPISLGQDGAGLGTMWGWETAERMLEEAGFPEIVRHVLPHDPMNVWFVSRKG
ncbi:MAG: methyltransferase domain-containing protein [Alphaproteobacteria bacterium]|nr:methyltransferase domain-containing protein [Alphaproteobacteria bacterium]